MGILSQRSHKEYGRPFGPPTIFFEECCQAAADLGIRAVIFEAADVDFDQSSVSSATIVDGRWVECEKEPWPTVIYDRAPVLDPMLSPPANRVRNLFDKAGIPFVNPLTFIHLAADKLKMYRIMAIGSLPVPHTECLDEHTLGLFLARYNHVYIKPRSGSQGMGVIEIVRSREGGHVVRTLGETYKVRSDGDIRKRIMTFAGGDNTKDGKLLVQKGISSESADERHFPRYDLRILMQKDGQARWLLTGLVARVSQTDGPTTNLSNGARAEEPEPVLDAIYGRPLRREILRSVSKMSFAICSVLEKKLGSIGELGLDIVPDAEGSPWIIEVNAKPGRNVFKRIAHSLEVPTLARLHYGALRRNAVTRPFEYAKTLSRIGLSDDL